MFALVKDNQIVKMGEIKALYPDVSFPSSGPDQAWKDANGIKEVVYGERKDERFYWVSEIQPTFDQSANVVRVGFTSTAKLLNDREESDESGNPLYVKVYDPTADGGKGAMVDSSERLVTKGLKSQYISQAKESAKSLLSQTDWKVIRAKENNQSLDSATSTLRSNIRTYSNTLEASISDCTTVEELITVINSTKWPTK